MLHPFTPEILNLLLQNLSHGKKMHWNINLKSCCLFKNVNDVHPNCVFANNLLTLVKKMLPNPI